MRSALFIAVVGMGLAACGPDVSGLRDQYLSENEGPIEPDTLSAGPVALTASNRASVWFPLRAKTEWVFRSGDSRRTVRLSEVARGIARIDGLWADGLWVGTATQDSTALMAWSSNDWVPLWRFGFVASPWSYGSGDCQTVRLRRVATGVPVITPAGSFSDTRTLAVEAVVPSGVICPLPAITELSFAAEVGLVAFRTGRGEVFGVERAVLGGSPMQGGSVEGSLQLDRTVFENEANTLSCDRAPCSSNARTADAQLHFHIENSSDRDAHWNFMSACQFDVEIISSSGEVVRRLSDERPCAGAGTSLDLAPGEGRDFSASISLHDRDGLQLDGSFEVRARLIPSGGGVVAPTASVPVSVSVRVSPR